MNALENTDLLTQETLMHVVNELVLAKKVNRQWEDKFGQEGAQVGDSIRIRKPTNYDIREGEEWVPQDLVDPYITLNVDSQIGIDWFVTSKEKTLSLDRVSERYLKPQARRIANEVDLRIARVMAQDCTMFSGTPGTAPTSVSTYQTAMSRLMAMGVPMQPRHIVQTPDQNQAVVTDLRGLVESGSAVAKQYTSGRMYRAFGADWDIDQNMYTHTTGALTGGGLVKGANQSGASILTDDWTASQPVGKKGDKITFPSVFAVNPITGATLGFQRPFTLTADVTADGSGNATLLIDPAIVLTGPYKNVSAAPTDDGNVESYGHVSSYAAKTSPSQLVFHPEACTVAIVGLAKPNAGEKSSYKSDEDAGISMRLINWYDGKLDRICYRWDLMLGIKMQLPDWCCVVPA